MGVGGSSPSGTTISTRKAGPIATVLIPIPSRDFDPSEVAVSWRVLTHHGHRVVFATPDGKPGEGDPVMLTGIGLDPWGKLPLLRRLRIVGLLLRADGAARASYRAMLDAPEFRQPKRWDELAVADFDGLLLPGGHWARGMRQYLESDTLQRLVAAFFAADKTVAAICHGVLLAARSTGADGKSVLYGRRTTALTWAFERSADSIARRTRWWNRDYYRTYADPPGHAPGWMSVEEEVKRALARPDDFVDVPRDDPDFRRKTGGLSRDTLTDDRAAWVVRDGSYLSARWPGDAHTFAHLFSGMLGTP